MSGTRARLSVAAVVVILLAPGGRAVAETTPVVDAAVQVTSNPVAVRGHATPVVAMHPEDPNVLAVAEADAYANECTVHTSTDAGLTWTRAAEPEAPSDWPGCMFSVTGVIADLAFASDGSLYYAFGRFDPNTYQQQLFLARSSDLGRTWNTATRLPWTGSDPERSEFGADALPSVVVDSDDADRVYVAWWSNNGMWNLPEALSGGRKWCRGEDRIVARPWVTVSADGGATFSEPVDMAAGVEGCTTEPYLVAGDDGEVFAFFGEAPRGEEGDAPPAHLYFSVSRDQGSTFTATPIHEQPAPNDGDPDGDSDWLSAPSPAMDPRSGDLYVAWEEMGEGVPRLLFMSSSDDGGTWTEPVQLNDVEPLRDWDFTEMFPTLTVAPSGRLDVAWYDFRNDPTFAEQPESDDEENGFQDVYYTHSTDGGRTWADNVRVTDRIIDRRFGARSTGYITGPVGMASTDDAAFVVWDDTRNGTEVTGTQDIYFTRVRFSGPDDVFPGSGSRASSVVWALAGAGGALALGGILLLLATRRSRHGAALSTDST